MFSVAVYTLGCKLNQLESEAIAAAFKQAGFALLPWGDGAAEVEATDADADDAASTGTGGGSVDILIINTCTVTSKADQKARRFIRKTLRENPRSCVIVTGCYAQLEPEAIEALEAECAGARGNGKRLFVLKGGAQGDVSHVDVAQKSVGALKSALLDLPTFLRAATAAATTSAAAPPPSAESLWALINTWNKERQNGRPEEGAFRYQPEHFSFHTRGFLKIQDGCDNHCTYCRVRLARGPSVSLPAEQALAQLLLLEAKGYAEAVLTGVNITQYQDLSPCDNLAGLLERLLAGSRRIALRLSSLEPEGITGRLADVLAHPRIRPHFHLSVQSGSPLILKRMGRPYAPETVEESAALLRSVKDNPFLACDIITGFPGETEAEFERSLSLCRNIGFAWIHAFPYSKRPGTAAFSFGEPVSERDAARRVDALLALARQGRRSYTQRWAGREVEALVEKRDAGKPGYCRGISGNYLKLLIKHRNGQAPQPGTVLRCRVGEVSAAQDSSGPDYDATADEVGLG